MACAPSSALVVAYGMGVDSTAMLVEFARRRIVPRLILFADTGGEKPSTYAYLPVIQAFLAAQGLPPVIVVRYVPKRAPYTTLEGKCLANRTLPALAYGGKSCSLVFKRDPQDRYCNHWAPAKKVWAAGGRLCKAIGYDAGPKDARRSKIEDDEKYVYWYPLREWGWDRPRCKAAILAAGLPLPPKSACWFCPANKPWEIAQLVRTWPEYGDRIREIEKRAASKLITVGGLWRKATRTRPARMTEFLDNLPPEDPVLAQVRAQVEAAGGADADQLLQFLFDNEAELRERARALSRGKPAGRTQSAPSSNEPDEPWGCWA